MALKNCIFYILLIFVLEAPLSSLVVQGERDTSYKTFISEIEFVGNTVVSDQELLNVISTKAGNVPGVSNIQEDIRSLEEYYSEKGFALMRVVDVILPGEAECNVLTFIINEGIVEDIIIEGNQHTKDYVLLRELELKKRGVFNTDQIMEDGKRLYNLGYFDTVELRIYPGTNPETVVVAWYVEEKLTYTINAGGSYGSVLGLTFFVDLNLDNFLGRGELVALKGEWGHRSSSYHFRYFNPWIAEKTSFTGKLWNTDNQIYEIEEGRARRIGGDMAVGKQLSDEWDVSFKVLYENVDPEDVGLSSYRSFSTGGSVGYDTRDIWINPTEGAFYSLTADFGLPFWGASLSLAEYHINLQNFYEVLNDQVIATRILFSEIYGEVPDTERFILGGGTTIRGFPDGAPFARGSRQVLSSIEYRTTLTDGLQGVLFFDTGRMSVADQGQVNFEGDAFWRYGYGLGVRAYTPIGPVRLDYGWTDPAGYLVNGERAYSTLHFSVGQAF